MQIKTANHSSYPRIGDGPAGQKLRKTCEAWQREKATLTNFQQTQDEFVQRALTEQTECGIDLVTDGMIRWYDPISHLCGKLKGVTIGGLLRFFDTNFYFRQPTVIGPLKRSEPLLVKEMKFALEHSSRPLKAVLTGPITCALLALNESDSYRQPADLVRAFVEIWAEEVRALSQLPLAQIQLDEPLLVSAIAPAGEHLRLLEPVWKAAGKVPLGLTSYFGDAQGLYAELQQSGFDSLGFDMSYAPNLWNTIAAEGSDKDLSLGVVDGRNTKLEEASAIAEKLKPLAAKGNKTLCLTPSCGLEFLPLTKAKEKLALLGSIKARLQ